MKLTQLRTGYAELANKRGEVREALAVQQSIHDAETRRTNIENSSDQGKEASVSDGDLSAAVADRFAQEVESVLKAWHFPDAERVHFDAKTRDVIIGGKPRTARGKAFAPSRTPRSRSACWNTARPTTHRIRAS